MKISCKFTSTLQGMEREVAQALVDAVFLFQGDTGGTSTSRSTWCYYRVIYSADAIHRALVLTHPSSAPVLVDPLRSHSLISF